MLIFILTLALIIMRGREINVNMLSRKELLEQEYAPRTTEQLSTVTTGNKTIGTTVTIEGERSVDSALEQTADLVSAQFKAWYAKQAYRLGVDRYLWIASKARQGAVPSKLFSYLLRRA